MDRNNREDEYMKLIVAIFLLGFIIFIHELGHFLLAKKNGITVTEFSLGMGPRLASFVKGGTRYSLKLLPIGGSCMMLGEDDTVDAEGSFHTKSVWARFGVIFGGAFFNFILAFILALILVSMVGVDSPILTKIEADSPAALAGLQEGDLITKINSRSIHFSREIGLNFVFRPMTGEPIDITYKRDGMKNTVSVIPKKIENYALGIVYSSELPTAELLEVNEGPLNDLGLVAGDVIVAINDVSIQTAKELMEYLNDHPLTNKVMKITYLNNGETKEVFVTPQLVTSYSLGIAYNSQNEKVSPVQTILNSVYELEFNIRYALDSLGHLISGKASLKEVSGVVGIVDVVGDIVDQTEDYGVRVVALSLINFCILISTNLGVMNLLPLPALDGGRLVFLLIEAVRRKPIAKEKEAIVHFVGMALLMVLMVFVLYNDVRKIFG